MQSSYEPQQVRYRQISSRNEINIFTIVPYFVNKEVFNGT